MRETHSTNGVGFVRLGAILPQSVQTRAKRGFGGDVRVPGSPETQNAFHEFSETRSERSGSEEAYEVRNKPAHATPVDNDIERVAAHLAFALRDQRSLAFYRLVARALPREVIRDALMRALDAHAVRRSRGALFAHIVRPHLQQRSLTNQRPS